MLKIWPLFADVDWNAVRISSVMLSTTAVIVYFFNRVRINPADTVFQEFP
jgi:hypothetical protein